jgi:hypothetical protein
VKPEPGSGIELLAIIGKPQAAREDLDDGGARGDQVPLPSIKDETRRDEIPGAVLCRAGFMGDRDLAPNAAVRAARAQPANHRKAACKNMRPELTSRAAVAFIKSLL